MKSFLKPLITATLVTCLYGAAISVQAADEAKPAAPAKSKSDHLPFHGKVASADAAAMTLTLEGKEHERVFQVTATTKITKNGAPATLVDVVAGDKVGGAYKKTDDGKMEALTLNFGEKPDKEKKAE